MHRSLGLEDDLGSVLLEYFTDDDVSLERNSVFDSLFRHIEVADDLIRVSTCNAEIQTGKPIASEGLALPCLLVSRFCRHSFVFVSALVLSLIILPSSDIRMIRSVALRVLRDIDGIDVVLVDVLGLGLL